MIRFLLPLLLGLSCQAAPLKLSQEGPAKKNLRQIRENLYELRAETKTSIFAQIQGEMPKGAAVLEFDYFCLGGIPSFAVIPGPPFDGAKARWSPALGHSEGWTPHRVRLSKKGFPISPKTKRFRLDFPIVKESTLRIRNPRIRPERPGEFTVTKSQHADTTTRLSNYLNAEFANSLKHIAVSQSNIVVQGTIGSLSEKLFLAEVPMEFLLNQTQRFHELTPIFPASDGSFSLTLPRSVNRNGRLRDRLHARWQIVSDPKNPRPASHMRYADQVHCRAPQLPPASLKSKKGLGGWSANHQPHGELEALGISAITVNITVHSVISQTPGSNTFPITWQGRTYHANRNALERYDRTFREAARHQVMVSAILLIANPARKKDPDIRLLGHPDAVPEGTYAMPNLISRDGLDFYGAALNLMAERWTRPDGQYGRVHHWIVHNEVDAGWTWTNCGRKELLPYLDLYQRSVRLVHLIAAQYDPHARAFLSLTHHWAKTVRPEFYPSKDILTNFVRFTEADGDFPWALAHHPYPQSLRHPRTWEDHQATDDFNTDKITPKNIQVLDRWMKSPAMRYLGKHVRPIHLSENGFNSPRYNQKSFKDQAAGMAYAWKKISSLDSVHVWHYHNWIDNRREGGLRIGLRKFPDDPKDPLGKKPIWHLYQALATPREEAALKPYLDDIGKEAE